MPSADRSQSGLISWLTALLHRLRAWTRQEVVSDDPWDRGESLFSDSPSEPARSDAPAGPDPVSPSSQREP
ncbi:MAG: hypothetical protein ACKO7W_08905 [Elainella sp.]